MSTFKKLRRIIQKREIKDQKIKRRLKMIFDAEEKNKQPISIVTDIIYYDTLTPKELDMYCDYYDMLCNERKKILRHKAIQKLFRRWV